MTSQDDEITTLGAIYLLQNSMGKEVDLFFDNTYEHAKKPSQCLEDELEEKREAFRIACDEMELDPSRSGDPPFTVPIGETFARNHALIAKCEDE